MENMVNSSPDVHFSRHYKRDAQDCIRNLAGLNERFSGKTILLTGAAGFLGAQFVHYFLSLNQSGVLAKPCRLIAIDNFQRGTPAWLARLRDIPELLLQQVDITNTRDFNSHDFIIHAASIASPIFYRKHPIETMDANVIGLRNLLDHAVSHPVEGFLYFSTSEIYGDPDRSNIPTPETYRGNVSCTGPRACYDESKRFGETLCVNFAKVRGVPVTIARPFNNYGPGLRLSDRRVLPDFFRDVLAKKDIVLLSDGLATRTFCYVSDAITGYIRVLLLGEPGEPYNIGTESPEINMRDLASLVIKIAKADVRLHYQQSEDKDYLVDNPQRRCPSIEKAKTRIGFAPIVGLEEGLLRMYQYYSDHADE